MSIKTELAGRSNACTLNIIILLAVSFILVSNSAYLLKASNTHDTVITSTVGNIDETQDGSGAAYTAPLASSSSSSSPARSTREPRQIESGIVVCPSLTMENPDPLLYVSMENNPYGLVPSGWDFYNPYASPGTTERQKHYWEVDITSLSQSQVNKYELLMFTSHHLTTFNAADNTKLQAYVTQGGRLWIDDCHSMRVEKFFVDINFAGSGQNNWNKVIVDNKDPLIDNPNSGMVLSQNEINYLGDVSYTDYISKMPSTFKTVVRYQNGEPCIAYGMIGIGVVVLSSMDISCGINDQFEGGGYGQLEDIKFAVNLIFSPLYLDLGISSSDIQFSKTDPHKGDKVTISATVHNIGSSETKDVNVKFYLGAAESGGVMIGATQIIAKINREGGTGIASVQWEVPKNGDYFIYVYVSDPDNPYLPDLLPGNDKAYSIITAVGPDHIHISDVDISQTAGGIEKRALDNTPAGSTIAFYYAAHAANNYVIEITYGTVNFSCDPNIGTMLGANLTVTEKANQSGKVYVTFDAGTPLVATDDLTDSMWVNTTYAVFDSEKMNYHLKITNGPSNGEVMVGTQYELLQVEIYDQYDNRIFDLPGFNEKWICDTGLGSMSNRSFLSEKVAGRTGKITVSSDMGTPDIIIDDPKSDSITITLLPSKIDSVRISPDSASLIPMNIETFTARAADKYGNIITNWTPIWTLQSDIIGKISAVGNNVSKPIKPGEEPQIIGDGLKAYGDWIKLTAPEYFEGTQRTGAITVRYEPAPLINEEDVRESSASIIVSSNYDIGLHEQSISPYSAIAQQIVNFTVRVDYYIPYSLSIMEGKYTVNMIKTYAKPGNPSSNATTESVTFTGTGVCILVNLTVNGFLINSTPVFLAQSDGVVFVHFDIDTGQNIFIIPAELQRQRFTIVANVQQIFPEEVANSTRGAWVPALSPQKYLFESKGDNNDASISFDLVNLKSSASVTSFYPDIAYMLLFVLAIGILGYMGTKNFKLTKTIKQSSTTKKTKL